MFTDGSVDGGMARPRVPWRRGLRALLSTGLVFATAALAGIPAVPVVQAVPGDAARVASAQIRESPARWHYAPNDNFGASGRYLPAGDRFNLADVTYVQQTRGLPSTDRALVWLGSCGGVDPVFLSRVRPFLGHPTVFGFYLVDDPAPSRCPPRNLKAESTWIHQHFRVVRVFIVLMNLSSPSTPYYGHAYTPASTGVDLFGLDMYPCRTELHGCRLGYITKAVHAAVTSGVPVHDIVPMYQAFGGGTWPDGSGGRFLLPSVSQERQIVETWASVIPAPAFDYAYSWGSQRGDISLSEAPKLQRFFAARN